MNVPPQKDLSKLFSAKNMARAVRSSNDQNMGQDEAPPGESVEVEDNIVIQETSHLPSISREEILLDQIVLMQGKEDEQSEIQKQISILDKTEFKKS